MDLGLISGIPDDVARDCLVRVSYQQFPVVASVSKGWKAEIETLEFRRRRKSTGHSQNIIVMVQARVDPMNPFYQLSVFEPETGYWTELPPPPELSSGLPVFCQLAGVGYDLVVMGGWDPDSWIASTSVYIYNFMSAKWRRGTDMPGGPRTFFACASDSDQTVYIAGGHDLEKNALKSAFAYDVARDEWFPLPDMAKERDECKAIFHGGKFHIIGGYCTDMQGRFERSAEAFDVATWRWDPVEEDFLETAICPRSCVDGDDERIFSCRDGDAMVSQGSIWQAMTKVPSGMCNVAYVWTWQGKLLLIGSSGYGEAHMAFELDVENHTWRKLDSPDRYTGHVQSGCCLEI